jgi:hypothetical protein
MNQAYKTDQIGISSSTAVAASAFAMLHADLAVVLMQAGETENANTSKKAATNSATWLIQNAKEEGLPPAVG